MRCPPHEVVEGTRNQFRSRKERILECLLKQCRGISLVGDFISSALRVHVLDHAQAQIRSLRGKPVAETDSAVSDQSEDNA